MRATSVLLAGTWDATRALDTVRLDFDARHRRRIALRTEAGREVLLDLPRAERLRDADALVLADGTLLRVQARAEALLEITASDPGTLLRIAWHLGNRHLPVQLLDGRLRIRADHVIAEMVAGLGGNAAPIDAPFDPEAGAYAGGGHHHHHHHHHDHDHH